MQKLICVLPCIRPSCHSEFLSKWKPLFDRHRVKLLTVWDGEDPILELDGKTIGKVSKVLPEDERELVPTFTDSCRNAGFLWAARNLEWDFTVSLDDDTAPVEGRDSLQEHFEVLGRKVSLSWMNTGHGDTPHFRGFPYRVRGEATVELSHSCWYQIPDFDAITQLYLGDNAKTHYEFFKGVIPRGVLAPLCFVPDAEVTLSDGTRKPISEVEAGDRVFSKGGQSHEVLCTLPRAYSGEIVELVVAGRDRPVVCTPNHPLWVLRKDGDEAGWVEASDVNPGDRMATPIVKGETPVQGPGLETARLLGYFLADGNYLKQKKTNRPSEYHYSNLQFSYGREKKRGVIEDTKHCLEALGINHRSEFPKETVECVMTQGGYRLADLFRDQYDIGEYSHGKRLPNCIFGWDVAHQRAMLAAYWAGDGCFTTVERNPVGRVPYLQYQTQAKTRSRTMAVQIQLLLQSLGIPSSVARLSAYKQSKECWAVSINGVRAKEFKAFLEGGDPPAPGKRSYDHTYSDDNFFWYKVKKTSRLDYKGTVYNLTVDTDHSYLVEGLVVKNCGMGLMWTRKAAPFVYYAAMGKGVGIHRFGDIWMGIALKREFDKRNYAVYTGHSMVNHQRASNVLKNLQDEGLGVALNEDWWEVGDSVHPYFPAYKKLREQYQVRMESLLGLA